jgi:hypothetical protein
MLLYASGLLAMLSLLAAEPGAPKPSDADSVDRWVRQLGSDNFEEREAASKALNQLGGPALSALEKAVTSDDAEVRRRAADLIQAIGARVDREGREAVLALGGTVEKSVVDPGHSLIVHLPVPKLTDADLQSLKWPRRISYLDLSGTQATGSGLAGVKSLAGLNYLILAGAKTTDAGLAPLEGFPNLTHLTLSGKGITDAGLIPLKGLGKLERLELDDVSVTDAGLVRLKGLSNLISLRLSSSQVTGAGLAHLTGLGNLQDLSLSGVGLTDEGLVGLESLRACARSAVKFCIFKGLTHFSHRL